jgi:hypothetical protein
LLLFRPAIAMRFMRASAGERRARGEKMNRTTVALLIASAASLPVASRAALLFSDDFSTNTSANWNVNPFPTANAGAQSAEFAFDYSGFGIPAAPGSIDTKGLRLRANIPGGAAAPVTSRPAGVLSGLSVSPTGKNFGNTYQVSFYAWSNFNGAANANGLADNANSEGGTNNVLFALGTSGTTPLVLGNPNAIAGSTIDGVVYGATGDGGIASDYRVFLASNTAAPASSGVYSAGTANDANGASPMANPNVYYTSIPSFAPHTAPAVQLALSTAEYGADASNTQAGQTQAGAFGFAWHHVVLTRNGNTASWTIDDVPFSNADISALTLGGNNFALGVSDVNTSTTRHPSLLFTLFDNVTVTDVVPEPASVALLALGGVALLGRRRARRS